MKLFISGVAGFLGSHLAESFLSEGHQVVGCDNLIGGELVNVPEGVEFYQYDCVHRNSMLKITKGCEVVFHCAATAHEGLSVFAPHVITQNTFGASIALFSAAIENKAKRIIYCSSMARYGCNELPFHEELEPRPQDPYGIAKVAAELVLKNLCGVHGVDFVIAVPHNIIGPRQKYDDPYRNVASIMINLMLQGRQPYIYGDGEQMRCFSFVQDCIYCLKKMAIQDDILGETINIGPDDEFVTINQLAKEIAHLIDFDLQPIYVAGRPQEVKHANCSADKARRLLGYETTTNLRSGLQSMIDYIQQKGVRPFQYYLDVEIHNEKLPVTWAKQLFLQKNRALV